MDNVSGIFPVADLVLVQPVEIEERSNGGILLVTTTKEKEEMATIHGVLVAKGETAEKHPATKNIDLGQMVIHAKFAGLRYKGKDGIWYRIMRAEDVLCQVEKAHDQTLRGRERLDNQEVTV